MKREIINSLYKSTSKKGISLITLVITIIVIIILAGAIILTLSQNNIIEDANEAVFRSNMAEYKSALDLYILSEQAKNGAIFNPATLNKTGEEIKSVIPSVKDEYINELEISSGKLKYIVTQENTKEGEWADTIADLEVEYRTDNTAPETVISSTVSTGNTITATIELSDDKSGVELTQSKYVVNTNATQYTVDDTIWNTATIITSNPQNISITDLAEGDYYVQVLSTDKTGNKKVSKSTMITILSMIQAVDDGQNGTPLTDNSTVNRNVANYNNPIIPKGFFPVNTVNASWNISGGIPQGWNNGLVIQDTYGNQFVWVPIYSGVQGLQDVPYTKWCTKNIEYNNTSISNDTFPEELNETTLANKYHGFYIARYESSFDYNNNNPRMITKKSTNITTSSWTKDNAHTGYLWNFITYSDAKSYAESMDVSYGYDTTKVGTNLITGTQWDTILKWLQNSGINVELDSSSWGNYYDVTFTYDYPTSGTKAASTSTLLNTGTTSRNSSKNIYDLAGNMWEWTNENYSSDKIIRGGYYGYKGSFSPASYRHSDPTSLKNATIGSRVALYIK